MGYIKQTEVIQPDKNNLVVKYTMTAAAIASLTFGINFPIAQAEGNTFESIQTVYHVYVGDKAIGTVNDKSMINQLIGQTILKAKERNPSYNFTLDHDVTFVSEKTFNPEYNNDQTVLRLQEAISVEAHGTAIQIGGQTIGYVKNPDIAKKVLDQFIEHYVSKKALKEYEKNKASGLLDDIKNGRKDLKDQEHSIILSIDFEQSVHTKESHVNPDKILTEDEAIQLIENGKLKDETYTVKDGDVISKITSKFNLSTKQLLDINPDLKEGSVLHIGDKVNVTARKPLLDVVVQQFITKDEGINYQQTIKQNNDMYKGQTKVIQQGKKGQKQIKVKEVIKNGKVDQKEILGSKTIQQPQNEVIEKGTKVIASRGTGQLQWPTDGGYISSKFGKRWGSFHKGIDIARVSRPAIHSVDNGVVVEAGYDDSGYGNRVVIDHKNGFKTTYNHMSSIRVHVGQTVRKGQTIGIIGQTGDATGIHLHFEVYENGKLMNPLNYF